MDIQILQMISGARKAQGLTVIIDVFRAFTTECYAFAGGCVRSYPIGRLEDAFAMKAAHPDYILLGERGGAKVEGCDLGNSPYDVTQTDFRGKCMVHSTSAGTQGIVAASQAGASEVVTGSLVNAKAVTDYIKSRHPEKVSIVAMGKAGVKPTTEDLICAFYMAYLLSGTKEEYGQVRDSFLAEYGKTSGDEASNAASGAPGMGADASDALASPSLPENESLLSAYDYISSLTPEGGFGIEDKIKWLKDYGGQQFFDPAQAKVFPREDYPLCVDYDRFDFVLRVSRNEQGQLEINKISPRKE